MNLYLNIIKNSLLLFIGRMINPAVTVAIGIYIAKSLGVEAFGQFTFILSYYFLFCMIFSLGLGTLVSRDTAKAPEQISEYFSNASFIGIISSVIGLVIMLFLGTFFNLSSEGRYALTIISFSIFASMLIFIWESLLITFGENQYITAIQGLEAVIKIIFGYFVLSNGHGLIFLMTVFMAARFLSCVLYYFVLRKVFHPLTIRISSVFIKKILSLVPTFAGLYVCSVVFSKIDLLMLARLKDFNDVGIFSAAYKLLDISFMLPTCVITVLFPVLSRYAQKDFDKFIQVSSNAIFYSMALLLPIILIAFCLADKIILALYSPDFSSAILPFQILIGNLGFYMLYQIFAHSLVAHNLQNLSLISLITATIVNVVLNFILIPKYSYLGASVATFASMAIITFMHYYFVRKHLYRINFLKMSLTPIPRKIQREESQ